MKAWHFSENAYPYLPPEDEYESVRITLPNKHYDPKIGAELYDRFLDEWVYAEEEGFNLMLNEHHQTATCVDPAAPLVLAALARLTHKARLLILGNPIANRRQPVRVAEEMALADILSKGRIEVGFVRGVPWEILPANSNPVRMNERHWEALNLILKAWTTHDGPFTHEGRFFHHRNVNIWPRPYQQPHPPVWVSTTSASGAAEVGRHGFVQATFLTGPVGTRAIFDSYRRGWREAGRPGEVPVNRLAYAAMVYTGETEAEAQAGAEKLLWFATANKIPLHLSSPPGYSSVQTIVQRRSGPSHPLEDFIKSPSVEGAVKRGMMFAGTPDQVYRQIRDFYRAIGGFGHLLVLGQSGFLDHADTKKGLRMFAREVFPRLQEEFPDTAISGHEAAAMPASA